jgi:subtilisin family serine protease
LSQDPIWGIPPDTVDHGLSRLLAPYQWHISQPFWPDVWKSINMSQIKVAILDTGINKHKDGPAPIVNKSYISGQSPADGNAHGTHCAGIAFSVARGCQLMNYKVLSNGGSGGSAGIAQAVRDAASDGAHVISMSLGGGGVYQPMQSALDFAWSKGSWVVAAAGNAGYGGNRSTVGYPAKYPTCMSTASYDSDGDISNFSSSGPEVDWACPGGAIMSWDRGGTQYRSMSGTSMACPYGAGMLAIMYHLMLREGLPVHQTTDDLRQFFKENMKDVGQPGFDVRSGYGIPMADEILDSIVDPLSWS